MDEREKKLIEEMRRDPENETVKVRYENLLRDIRPESIERQFLQLEREIAYAHFDQAIMNDLIDKYVKFTTAHFDWFWDHRGGIQFRRSFNVWLVSVAESRQFAVRQAVRLVQGIETNIHLDRLPTVLRLGVSPLNARDTKERFLEFVKRYKGPRGDEPEVEPHEVILRITPSWINL